MSPFNAVTTNRTVTYWAKSLYGIGPCGSPAFRCLMAEEGRRKKLHDMSMKHTPRENGGKKWGCFILLWILFFMTHVVPAQSTLWRHRQAANSRGNVREVPKGQQRSCSQTGRKKALLSPWAVGMSQNRHPSVSAHKNRARERGHGVLSLGSCYSA